MDWWAPLPRALAERWELVPSDFVARGASSLVLGCRRADGRAAVLKLAPEPSRGLVEARALRLWGNVAPEVFAVDEDSGALLLEAIDGENVDAACDVAGLIRALHAPGSVDGFPSLAERVEFIFAQPRWRAGRDLARSLAADPVEGVLLHGDLHPANVLDGGPARGLVAIDPRPCVGDPAFDVVDWLGDSGARCRSLASSLGLDAARVWAWRRAFRPELPANGWRSSKGGGQHGVPDRNFS